jgi:hypothetical protein
VAATLPRAVAHPTGVPRAGDVFWLDTSCYGGDKKPTRPAVVIRGAIPGLLNEVAVVVRTSVNEFSGTHVEHPKDLTIGLDREGKFPKTYRRLIDLRFFKMPAFTSYQGPLPEPHLSEILKMMNLL